MKEVPVARENHGHFASVGCIDDFLVSHRAARLNGSGRSSFTTSDQSICKREHRITRDHAAFEGETGLFRFPDSDTA
jgi:hypothetical protein